MVFAAVADFTPSASQLKDYAGVYSSEEIEPLYEIKLDQGGLVLHRLKNKPDALHPITRDLFAGSIGSIRFTRTTQGEISGFMLSTGRVRKFRFGKAGHRSQLAQRDEILRGRANHRPASIMPIKAATAATAPNGPLISRTRASPYASRSIDVASGPRQQGVAQRSSQALRPFHFLDEKQGSHGWRFPNRGLSGGHKQKPTVRTALTVATRYGLTRKGTLLDSVPLGVVTWTVPLVAPAGTTARFR